MAVKTQEFPLRARVIWVAITPVATSCSHILVLLSQVTPTPAHGPTRHERASVQVHQNMDGKLSPSCG